MRELKEGLSCINSWVRETMTPSHPSSCICEGMQEDDGIRCGVMEGRFARRHNCGDAVGRVGRVGIQRHIGVVE